MNDIGNQTEIEELSSGCNKIVLLNVWQVVWTAAALYCLFVFSGLNVYLCALMFKTLPMNYCVYVLDTRTRRSNPKCR